MADNYEILNQQNDEIFGPDDTENRSLNSWMLRSALKGVSGLVLAIGFLPIVLWYIGTSTILLTFSSTTTIWTGLIIWAAWFYLERKHNKKTSQ